MSERQAKVDFDPLHFGRRAANGEALSATEAFRHAYHSNLWGGPESPSGPGSSLAQTVRLQEILSDVLTSLGVRTLLDLPCGDGHWMAGIDLGEVRYLGADLLPEVVARAAARSPQREFVTLDLTTSWLPAADLLLCRDCLVHLSFHDIARAIANIRRAGVTYVLATTFPDEPGNIDVVTGDWRPLNLERPPLEFPTPIRLLREGCTENGGTFADKSLGLWRASDLPTWP